MWQAGVCVCPGKRVLQNKPPLSNISISYRYFYCHFFVDILLLKRKLLCDHAKNHTEYNQLRVLFSHCANYKDNFPQFSFLSLTPCVSSELRNVNVWKNEFQMHGIWFFYERLRTSLWYGVIHFKIMSMFIISNTKHINNFASDCLHWFSSRFFYLVYIFMLAGVVFLSPCTLDHSLFIGKQQTTAFYNKHKANTNV